MWHHNLFRINHRMLVITVLFFAAFVSSPCTIAQADPGNTPPPLELEEVQRILDNAKASYAKVHDYTTMMHKEEYKDGEIELDEDTIIKFQKPFKVYLKWVSGDNAGSQLLYVKGKYDNKMIVRKGGGFLKKVFGTMEMDPYGFWLRKFTKHSIDEVGFGGLIEKSHEQFQFALEKGFITAAQSTLTEFDGKPAYKVVFVVSPEAEEDGYYCHSAIQYFDAETFMPVKSTFWLWEEDAAEIFTYSDIKLNVGLPDVAFDRDNEEYQF